MSLLSSCEGSHTEGCRGANDDTLALDLLGEVDLVTGGVLNQDVQVGDGVALLDEGGRGVMEESSLSPHARGVGSETAGSKHFGGNWWWEGGFF